MKLEITVHIQNGDAEAIRDIFRPLVAELVGSLRRDAANTKDQELQIEAPVLKKWMSTGEVAAYMGCHSVTVLRLLRSKQMVGHQAGPKASWRISGEDVEKYIRGGATRKKRSS